MKIYKVSQWEDSFEYRDNSNLYIELLQTTKTLLIDLWKVCDESLADLINDIETAIKFIDYALENLTKKNTKNALLKALVLIEQESDHDDAEHMQVVNDIKRIIYEL